MRTSKQSLRPIATGYTPAERFSLRIEDGVEIYEHEAMHTCSAFVSDTAGPGLGTVEPLTRGPQLIVDETRSGETFISKARSEIAELSNLLRSMRGLREV